MPTNILSVEPPTQNVSIWVSRNAQENEIITSWQQMKGKNPGRAAFNIGHVFNNVNAAARREGSYRLDKIDGCFYVVEHYLPKTHKNKHYIAYISLAGDKTCLLLISHGPDRQEAKRRATVWISKCENRELHGSPHFHKNK